MRAGEHDRVGARGAVLDEAGRDLGADRLVVDRLARERRFGERRKPRRADQRDVAALPRNCGSARGCIRARRSPRCRAPRRSLRLRGRAGRLDRRHGADEGQAKRSRSAGSTSVEAVLQAITTRSGRCASISSVHQRRRRASTSSSLRDLAVGKQRVVRRIDEARIGPRACDLAEHRQPADAGVEHQNAGRTHDAGSDRWADQDGAQRGAIAGRRSKTRRGDQRQPRMACCLALSAEPVFSPP